MPLIVATVCGFEVAILLYSALGNRLLMGIAVVVALLLTPFAPFCADLLEVRGLSRIALQTVAIIATVLAALASVVVPAFSAKSPERINIDFWQDGDSGKSVWIVEPESHRLPEPIQLAAHPTRQDAGPFPWSTTTSFVADAPHQDLAPPTFTILESSEEGSRRAYRTLMRSERGAQNVMVFFPPDSGVESVRMEDEPIPPQSERLRRYLKGWIFLNCLTVPAKGVELSFTLPIGKSVSSSDVRRIIRTSTRGHLSNQVAPSHGNHFGRRRYLARQPSCGTESVAAGARPKCDRSRHRPRAPSRYGCAFTSCSFPSTSCTTTNRAFAADVLCSCVTFATSTTVGSWMATSAFPISTALS